MLNINDTFIVKFKFNIFIQSFLKFTLNYLTDALMRWETTLEVVLLPTV